MPHLCAKTPGTWILVIIWSQIKSFRHKLSLTYNQKKSFTKVSTFDQLNKYHHSSFSHKLSHFVTSSSQPPIKKLLLQKFLHLINWLQKRLQKNDMGVHLVTNKVISSQHVHELLLKNFFHQSFYFWSIEYKNAIRKLNGCSFGHKLSHFVTTCTLTLI